VADGLVLAEVSYERGRQRLIRRQSFGLPSGGTLVVTGANGVGKSTLLYLCAGLIAPAAGTISLNGHVASAHAPSELIRRGVRRAFVFQQRGLVANLSALDNVALPLRYHADELRLSEQDIVDRTQACLGKVGLDAPEINELPGRLSFGIRKRVALARAMAIEPNFAFFDDPDTGLDREKAELVADILVRYRDDPTITMVVATNHRALIERLGLEVHELIGGKLVRELLDAIPASAPLV
jgi:phospholipid/cholesterol/gamma-HCH transport system ATP-binding protein